MKKITQDFRVPSDLMNDGTQNAILKGSYLKATKLPFDLWEESLMDKKYMFWAVKALTLKHYEICVVSEYNRKEGYIICSRLNKNFKGFKVNIDDIQALYYITHITREIVKEGSVEY